MLKGWTTDTRFNGKDQDLEKNDSAKVGWWWRLEVGRVESIYCEVVVLRGSAVISMTSLYPSSLSVFMVIHLQSLLLKLLSSTAL